MSRSRLRLAAAVLTLVATLTGVFAVPVAQTAPLPFSIPLNDQVDDTHGLKVTYYKPGRDQSSMMNMFGKLSWVQPTAASPGNGTAFKEFMWEAPAHFNYDTAAAAGYARDYSWANLNPDYVEITGFVDMRGAWDIIVFSMDDTRMALWVNGEKVTDNWEGHLTGFVYFKYASEIPPVIHVRLCMAKPTTDEAVNAAWPVNVRFDTEGIAPLSRLSPDYPIDAFNTFVHIDDAKDNITVDAPPVGVDLSKYEYSVAGGPYYTLPQGTIYVGQKAGDLVVRNRQKTSSSTVIGKFTVPAPRDVAVKQRTSITTTLTWAAPASPVAPKSYEIYRTLVGRDDSFGKQGTVMISMSDTGGLAGSTTDLTYTDRGLEVGGEYSYKVRAVYEEAYVDSDWVQNKDVQITGIPDAPKVVWVDANGGGKVRLRWDTVSGAKKYLVRREYHTVPAMAIMFIGQELIGEHFQGSYTDDKVIQGSTCSYFVQTVDANGEVSRISSPVTLYVPDATPPSVPGDFWVEGSYILLGPTGEVSMSWKASTDNLGVVGYDILRKGRIKDGTLPSEQSVSEEPVHVVGTTTGTTFTDSGLSSGGYYTYYVVAKDAAGNTSTTEGINVSTGCAYLRAIALMSGGKALPLEPEFNYRQSEYTLKVPNEIKALALNPARIDPKSTVKVNGKVVADGDLVWPLNLGIGDNRVEIEVAGRPTWALWPEDTTTYVVTITRANLAELPVLTLPEGEEAILEGETYEASGSITSVSTSPWTGTVDYGDGSKPAALVVGADGVFALRHKYLDSGEYEVGVKFTYSDLGLVTGTVKVPVGNVAPKIEFDDGTEYTVDEGSALKLTGKVLDPGADTWTMTADYGDPSGPEPVTVGSDGIFAIDKVLYDAEPVRTVTLEVADDDGDKSTGEFTVNVKNVAPTVEADLLPVVQRDVPLIGSGAFVDPGQDVWLGSVDFGDGSGDLALQLRGDKSFPLEHVYTKNGAYAVTITVVDNNGGVGTVTYPVTVKDYTFSIDAGADAETDEGAPFDRRVAVIGPADKVVKLTVDYGDGSAVENLTPIPGAAAGTGTASLHHVYGDNGTYAVTVNLVDTDNWVYEDSFDVNVKNVAPVVKLDKGLYTSRGWVQVTGSFSDPGLDKWSATIDFGDGSGPQVVSLRDSKTFAASHDYSEGHYTVNVSVSDDDGGMDLGTCWVSVVDPSSNSLLASLTLGHQLYSDVGRTIAVSFSPLMTEYYISGAISPPVGLRVDTQDSHARVQVSWDITHSTWINVASGHVTSVGDVDRHGIWILVTAEDGRTTLYKIHQ